MAFVAGTPLTAAQLNTLLVSAVGGVLLTDSTQSILTAAFTDVTWGTEVSDPDGWTSGGSATLTVPAGEDGRYLVCYLGSWSALPGAIAGAVCQVNGTPLYQTGATNSLTVDYSNTLTFLRTFAAGDTLKFQAYQNSGSSRNLNSRLEICPA